MFDDKDKEKNKDYYHYIYIMQKSVDVVQNPLESQVKTMGVGLGSFNRWFLFMNLFVLIDEFFC